MTHKPKASEPDESTQGLSLSGKKSGEVKPDEILSEEPQKEEKSISPNHLDKDKVMFYKNLFKNKWPLKNNSYWQNRYNNRHPQKRKGGTKRIMWLDRKKESKPREDWSKDRIKSESQR